MGPERPPAIDHGNTPLLGLDDQPLEHAVAGERHEIARGKPEHLLVAPEPCARSQTPLERERDLRHLALLGP